MLVRMHYSGRWDSTCAISGDARDGIGRSTHRQLHPVARVDRFAVCEGTPKSDVGHAQIERRLLRPQHLVLLLHGQTDDALFIYENATCTCR